MGEPTREHHQITWRGIVLAVTFTPERFGLVEHLEITAADRRPLPITETGYRSQFMACGTVAEHGGAVAYVTAWLDHEAARTGWTGAQQLSLF